MEIQIKSPSFCILAMRTTEVRDEVQVAPSKLRMDKSKIIDPQDNEYDHMEPSYSRTPKRFFLIHGLIHTMGE